MNPKAVSFIVAVAVAPSFLSAQERRPNTRVEADGAYLKQDVALGREPLQVALVSVLRAVGRPGGAVVLSGCNGLDQIPLLIHSGATLASALDLLTSTHSTYRWTMEDGVINLLPNIERARVTDVRIERFEWNTADSVHLVVSNLSQIGTVKRYLAGMRIERDLEIGPGLEQAPRIVNGVPAPPLPGRQCRVENTTLLTALNAVADSYRGAVWFYEERTCSGRKAYSFYVR